jgi:magnesium chelatase family protein
MAATVATVAYLGLEARAVEVQVQLTSGVPKFTIVGLPDKAVAESRERVRAALASIGLALPPKVITINLSPADLPKEGSHYDLPIALGLLAAIGATDAELCRIMWPWASSASTAGLRRRRACFSPLSTPPRTTKG